MDGKSYNVDDILSEIKSRKLREKAMAAAKEGGDEPRPASSARSKPGSTSAAESTQEPRQRSATRPAPETRDAPAAPEWTREPRQRSAPRPVPETRDAPAAPEWAQETRQKSAARPAPETRDAPAAPEWAQETRQKSAARPVPETRDAPAAPEWAQEPRQRSAARPAPETRDAPAAPEWAQEPRQRSAPRPAPETRDAPAAPEWAQEPRRRPAARPSPQGARIQEEFHFDMPADIGENPPFRPMDFEGEAQSIADRARARADRAAAKRFEFKPDVMPDSEPGVPEAPIVMNKPHEQTRVMPSVTDMLDYGARELKTTAVKEASFGKFALDPGPDRYYDDPEDDISEGSVVDYSEYNSASDRRDVQRDIAHVKLWLFIRVSLTFIGTAILFILSFAGKYDFIPLPEFMFPEVPETLRAYYIVCTALTILIAVINSSAVGGGLMGLFKMHSNSDSLAACAVLAAVAQGVLAVANTGLALPGDMNLYFPVASLAMLFNALGKMTMINRILSNFRIISSNLPKKALLPVESDDLCREFFKDLTRRPVIAHSVGAGFFTDFLGLSYSDKYDVGVNRAVAPVCLAGSLAVAAVTYMLTGSVMGAVSSVTAILCVCATLSSTFIENVPLAKLTKKLAPQGGMVSGNKAVEDFCDAKAVILSETDLFPPGNVKLHGVKALPQGRVDEAIVDAASVLCSIDGALGPVFLGMIGGDKKLLRKVDNIAFENAMGISAWVDSRRVLIGNRRLLLNHGITLPPEALVQKQITSESEPLFLASAGEACAMFTVSYHIDEDLASQLDKMGQREKLLIVHTTDANITAEKIWELYGYPIELIRILPAEWHSAYHQLVEPRDRAVAEIVYTGKASVMIKALLACVAARSSILSATVIQLMQIILGYTLLTFMAFMGSIATISVSEICLYQLFWFAAISIVQQIRHS